MTSHHRRSIASRRESAQLRAERIAIETSPNQSTRFASPSRVPRRASRYNPPDDLPYRRDLHSPRSNPRPRHSRSLLAGVHLVLRAVRPLHHRNGSSARPGPRDDRGARSREQRLPHHRGEGMGAAFRSSDRMVFATANRGKTSRAGGGGGG